MLMLAVGFYACVPSGAPAPRGIAGSQPDATPRDASANSPIDGGFTTADAGFADDAAIKPDATQTRDAGQVVDAGHVIDAGMTPQFMCPPSGPFGTSVGSTTPDIQLPDCDGNMHTVHNLCAKKASWFFGMAGW